MYSRLERRDLPIKFFVLNFFSTNYTLLSVPISRDVAGIPLYILSHDRLAHIIMYLIRV